MSDDLEDEAAGAERGPLSNHAPRPAAPTEVPSGRTSIAARPSSAECCPDCGAKRIGDDVYCEGCGYDFENRRPKGLSPSPVSELWEVLVMADRESFERSVWEGVAFPDHFIPVSVPLQRRELRIGRGSPDDAGPEIDLEDPAVSRLHALLVRQDDGSYSIVDQGSTNGTTLNDDPTPLAANVAVPLADGDRVHLGAWTTITLRRIGSGDT